MRLKSLALATATSICAMAMAANAGPRGGAVGGAVGGAFGGGGLGASGHGFGGASGGFGGGPGLGGAVGGGGAFGGTFGSSIAPPLGGEHRIGSGAAGLSGSANAGATSSVSPNSARVNSQGPAHASATGTAHASDRSVLSTTRSTAASVRDDAEQSADRARDAADDDAEHTGHRDQRTGKTVFGRIGEIVHGLRGRTEDVEGSASARANRMGPARASANGVANSNVHAGLREATPTTNPLSGLDAGMTVRSASGETLGTVTRVVRSADGRVQSVLVRTASGARRIVHLAPQDLTVSGDVATTTSTALHGGGHG